MSDQHSRVFTATPTRAAFQAVFWQTKQARDECVVMNGEENCAKIIEQHKACLRAEGFNVRSRS
jgi:hypothetical protein